MTEYVDQKIFYHPLLLLGNRVAETSKALLMTNTLASGAFVTSPASPSTRSSPSYEGDWRGECGGDWRIGESGGSGWRCKDCFLQKMTLGNI